VRQKLLEHVAGALIMQPQLDAFSGQESGEEEKMSGGVAMAARQSMAMTGENTPPRSPTKSTSPQRLADPVKVFAASPEPMSRQSVESIRIYADSDVYALLAVVEEEINRMGQGGQTESEGQTMDAQEAAPVDVSSAVAAGITLSAVAFSGISNVTSAKAGFV
jgi:hypothetical protein